jgi:3-dehydrosphinganine reductase
MAAYKLALITGGSSGIGFAAAKQLVLEGTDVCLLARDFDKLQAAQQTLSELTVRKDQHIQIISADVSHYEDLAYTLEEWTADFGIPDLLINAAGVVYPGYFQELAIDTFRWQMDINYFGTLHTLKCLIPGMIQRGSGTVVNISSIAGFLGVFGYSGYGASKYAVRGLSDVLRAEMKPLGIQVAIVFPPDTQTPQLDFDNKHKPHETKSLNGNKSVLTAEQVANAMLTGIRKGRYVIIPGFEGKFFYFLIHLFGNLTYPIMDILIRKAQKSK